MYIVKVIPRSQESQAQARDTLPVLRNIFFCRSFQGYRGHGLRSNVSPEGRPKVTEVADLGHAAGDDGGNWSGDVLLRVRRSAGGEESGGLGGDASPETEAATKRGGKLLHSETRSIYVLFHSSAVLDPRVGHTMDVLSPFIPVLCHSD